MNDFETSSVGIRQAESRDDRGSLGAEPKTRTFSTQQLGTHQVDDVLSTGADLGVSDKAYRAVHRSKIVKMPGKKLVACSRRQRRSFSPSQERPGASKVRARNMQHTDRERSTLTIARPRSRSFALAVARVADGLSPIGRTVPGQGAKVRFSQELKVARRVKLSSKIVQAETSRNAGLAGRDMTGRLHKKRVASRHGVMAESLAPIVINGIAQTGFGDPPAGRYPGDASGFETRSRRWREEASSDTESEYKVSGLSGAAVTSPVNFSHMLDDYFIRQARLPPSGATAFDPRLTPAWAGLKLPI